MTEYNNAEVRTFLPIKAEHSIEIEIGGKVFELKGKIGDHTRRVSYRQSFKESITVGSFNEILNQVDKALSADGILVTRWSQLSGATLPDPLKTLVEKVTDDIDIRITYLAIDTLSGRYGFGFGINFSNSFKVNGIELRGFALELSATKRLT